jgi:hypothetical protein
MGLDGETDIERLPSRNGKAASPRSDQTKSRADPVRLANESHKRLLGDPAALAHLSSTRGVDKATAERFRVGITGKIGNRFWTFPIPGPDGNVIAVKAHRADGQDQKSWWSPEGVNRNHVWPVSIQGPGPVWVCSGELKALAVISTGRSAIGITSGEGSSRTPCDLPAAALQLLAGKSCALAPDDDECGEAWGRHVLRQMAQAAIDCREVNLGLDKAAGLKDIGDFIVRLYENGKSPDEVA